jgi:hypothetical protein
MSTGGANRGAAETDALWTTASALWSLAARPGFRLEKPDGRQRGCRFEARLSHEPVRKPVRQSVVGQQCSKGGHRWLSWDAATNQAQFRRVCPTVAEATSLDLFVRQP